MKASILLGLNFVDGLYAMESSDSEPDTNSRARFWKSAEADPTVCYFCEEDLEEDECEAYEEEEGHYAIIADGKGYQPDLIAPICGLCQEKWCWCSEGPCINPCPSCEAPCDDECGCIVDCSRCGEEEAVEFLKDNLRWDAKQECKEPVCEDCQES